MDTSKSILEKVYYPNADGKPFPIFVKRDDFIDPVISGNKWRKLQYNLLKAAEQNKKGILTFGGAYSNHLIATAKAVKNHHLSSIGIVRGEELNENSNPTLRACASFGMDLIFISRQEYKERHCKSYQYDLLLKYPSYYLVPEGGKNYLGVVGCQHILQETPNDFDHIYVAGGTGTTAAGVLLSSPEQSTIHVVSALKGDFLKNDISQWVQKALFDEDVSAEYINRLHVYSDQRFGGYAKTNQELIAFVQFVKQKIKLPLDLIYTGKTFYQLIEDYKNGRIKSDEKVLFIHTGGLQGNQSLPFREGLANE